jgi:hypothetical protein
MKIYHYNPYTFEYLGEGLADKDPLDEGNWLIPAYATEIVALTPQENKTVNFENGQWVYKDITQPEIELTLPTPEELFEMVRLQRQRAYQTEADPLFFKAQRGEATQDEWLAIIANIKARFPYQE